MKFGIFYGSTTGNTEAVAQSIADEPTEHEVVLKEVTDASPEDFEGVDVVLCGSSTWDIGELQYDWADFLPDLKGIDLKGKAIGFFGMGDAIGYPYNYLDCLGELWETLKESGAKLVGRWPTEGYSFDESRAQFEEGWFLGVGLDDDNEPELTEERVGKWLEQVKAETADLFLSA